MKKFIAILLVAILFAYTAMPVFSTESDIAYQALLDARRDAEADASAMKGVVLGFFCGLIGVGITYFTPPSPPVHRFIGKSSEYVLLYTDEYRRVARKEETFHAIGGCAMAVAFTYFFIAINSSN